MIYLQAQVVLDIYFYKQGYYMPIKFLIKKNLNVSKKNQNMQKLQKEQRNLKK